MVVRIKYKDRTMRTLGIPDSMPGARREKFESGSIFRVMSTYSMVKPVLSNKLFLKALYYIYLFHFIHSIFHSLNKYLMST